MNSPYAPYPFRGLCSARLPGSGYNLTPRRCVKRSGHPGACRFTSDGPSAHRIAATRELVRHEHEANEGAASGV